MIEVTRLDGTSMLLNADLIEWIERTPDTLIGLVNGNRYLVREVPDELVRRVVEYRRAVSSASGLQNHHGGRDGGASAGERWLADRPGPRPCSEPTG